MDFSDMVCVVTGASSGIGRRTALDLAAEGARVCVAARREARLKELVDEMGGVARHTYVVTDVSKRDDVAVLAVHVESTYGRCDVLVNNAGFSGESGPFEGRESVANLTHVMDTNFYGAVYCTAELLPLLMRSAPSHVVNVASFAGRLAFPDASAYCASKFAMVGWSEALHFELAGQGVCVSTIEPGFIPTEGFPQEQFQRDRFLKLALGSDAGVSQAIRHAIEHRKLERVVPRWYYLLQVPRLLAPRFYRFAVTKLAQTELAKRAASGS